MIRALQRFPLTFWLITAAIVTTGAVADATHGVPFPLFSILMPCILTVTTLFQIAACILLTVIFSRSQRWELQPLIILFLASALLDAAVFLTIRMPGRATSLILPGNTATPWLLLFTHVALSICAVAYAVARSARGLMTAAATRRAIRVWFPAWTVLIIAMIIAIVVASSPHAPSYPVERTTGTERLIVFGVELLLSTVALILFIIYIERATLNWIDLSIVLMMIAGLTGLAINARLLPRENAPWATAEVLYLWSATFVLVASIHDLVDRLGDSLRNESRALHERVTVAEQNAKIETSILKSRFVAMVSHELRTPLAGIIGMAELLEREGLSERHLAFTKSITDSARGLHRIVSDLLDFSHAESGQIELEDREFNLEQAVDDVVVLFREQARQRGISLSAFVDPSLPRLIRGDQTRLKQVLTNLVGNAVRFTTAGSIRIEVESGADTGDDDLMRIFVSDTGIGIAPSALDRIFEAFVQEDASTARKFGGTGLGLAIVKHIVELMGGRIEVWSTQNVGTTFLVTLPTRPARLGLAEVRSLPDVGVLVFEENRELLLLLMRFMDGWKMHAVGVSTASEARAAITEQAKSGLPFDVLLVGSGVAGNNARALLGEIRAASDAPPRAILIRDPNDPETGDVTPAFDLCVNGALRQSALFDALMQLLSNGAAPRQISEIQGVPARERRTQRILVAEDNEVNQALLVAQLEHLGFQADVVRDGKAAIAAVERMSYGLIFMDCQMPEIDGFEATRRIRESKGLDVPIVALTAHVLPGYRETCLAAGMNDYLSKPALIGPLSEMVDRWIPENARAPLPISPEPATSIRTDGTIARMRERLLDVFHGDVARTDRVIALSLRELKDGATSLSAACASRNLSDATNIAHRLKGIALEIGSVEVAARSDVLEQQIQAQDWDRAEAELRSLTSSIEDALLENRPAS